MKRKFADERLLPLLLAGLVALAPAMSPAFAGEYDEDEDAYVEAFGAQAVNTGYFLNSASHIEIDFQITDVKKETTVFGADGGDGTSCRLWMNSNAPGLEPNLGGWGGSFEAAGTERRVAVFDVPTLTVTLRDPWSGTAISTKTSANGLSFTSAATRPLALFARCTSGDGATNVQYGACRIYSFKVAEGGSLVHDFRPATKGGEPGFFDAVTGGFFGINRLGGNDLEVGGGYEILEDDPWIESDGTTILNTGILPDADMRLEVDYALATTNQNDTRILGACPGDSKGPILEFYVNLAGNGIANMVADGWPGGTYMGGLDTRRRTFVADVANRVAYMRSGATTYASAPMKTPYITSRGALPLALFGRIVSSNGSSEWAGGRSKVRVYGLKCYRGGALANNFVPCVKGGVAGFRDEASGVFHSAERNCAGLTASANAERIPDDGYIELAGNDMTKAGGEGGHYIDTGYTPGPDTRVELDYAFGADRDGAGDWYALACGSSSSSMFALCETANSLITCLGTNRWVTTGLPAQTNAACVRRTLSLDAANNTIALATAGYTNFLRTGSARWVTGQLSNTIKLGGTAMGGGGFAPLRIYGFRVYESGSLVRDYVPYVTNGAPVLRYGDGGVAKVSWNATYGKAGLPAAGGTVAVSSARDSDAYALFSGAQSVDTGYKANSNSCFVVDFSFANGYNKPQQYVFETGASASDGLIGRIYTSGSGGTGAGYSWSYSKAGNWTATGVTVDHQRRLFTIDATNDVVRMEPGGYVGDATIAELDNGYACTKTTKIGSGADGTGFYAKMRLYRFTIYDSGEKVREYVPCVIGGAPCLYDLVNGVAATAPGLAVSGRGHDGAEVWIERPGGTVSIVQGRGGGAGRRDVTVRAVGAKSYRWLMNGNPVDGGGDGSLAMLWQKAWQTDVYTVIPVYEVFGETVEGAPVRIDVQSVPSATYIIVR